MNKKVLIRGAIASVFLVSASSVAFAQSPNPQVRNNHPMSHMKDGNNHGQWLQRFATKFNLNIDSLQKELQSGKTMKDIFQEHGVPKDQLKGMFGKKFPGKHMHKPMLPPSKDMLEISASILGITPDQLQKEFESHKPLPEMVKEHGLTMPEFMQKSIEALKQRIQSGQATPEQTDRYNHIIDKLTHTQPKA